MKNSLYYFLIYTTFVLLSCTSNTGVEINESLSLEFGVSKAVPFKMSEMIDSVSYICLEGNRIGNIDDIKFVNKKFYICDKKQGTIYIYNIDGTFVYEFNHKGRANNEYISLGDFDVSLPNGNIHIYDDATHRFIVYSGDYNFLRTTEMFADAIKDFAVLENGDYLMYKPDYIEGSKRGLWVTNDKLSFKKQLVSIDDNFKFGGIYPKYLIRKDLNVFGLMGGEDKNNIYEIIDDDITNICHIDINIDIPEEVKKNIGFDKKTSKGKVYTKNSYIETSRWLMFLVTDMHQYTLSIYDKKNKIHHQITKDSDFIEDINVFGALSHLYNNYAYSILYPEHIQNNEKLKELFPKVSKDSNPVIIIAKFSD